MSELGEEVNHGSTEEEAAHSLTGMALSEALGDENFESKEHHIILSLKDGCAPEVTMTGFWDGQLLKAAMRAIERKYDDVRRHATVYAMKQAQLKNGEAK